MQRESSGPSSHPPGGPPRALTHPAWAGPDPPVLLVLTGLRRCHDRDHGAGVLGSSHSIPAGAHLPHVRWDPGPLSQRPRGKPRGGDGRWLRPMRPGGQGSGRLVGARSGGGSTQPPRSPSVRGRLLAILPRPPAAGRKAVPSGGAYGASQARTASGRSAGGEARLRGGVGSMRPTPALPLWAWPRPSASGPRVLRLGCAPGCFWGWPGGGPELLGVPPSLVPLSPSAP